jgi:hypothetical protein
MRAARIDELVATVNAICASPEVEQYCIGLTATPLNRQRMYRRAIALMYPHFVILATDLTKEQALEMEAELQAAVKSSKTARLYRKYDPERRDAAHRASVGGSKNYTSNDYSVYMSWR